MKVTLGRVLDLHKVFKPLNFLCGLTVIISGFGVLRFGGGIFDGLEV
jgi:hypothetical protein